MSIYRTGSRLHSSAVLLSLLLALWCIASEFRLAESGRIFACDQANRATAALPFCNVRLSKRVRVGDLIGRLTLQEKIRMLVNNAAPVRRLGIPGYEWWSEALHGVSNVGPGTKFSAAVPRATSFPQVITTAASFNDALFHDIGRVVSDEARAMYNEFETGLTFWSPNVNIFRDPRWGRGQETPGEDPLLASNYAVNYVRGLQGGNPRAGLKVAACCKHFTAYDLDNWRGLDRFHFDARVTPQDLADTFNVPFEACVRRARVASVMCSYNKLNGVPTCADPNLLQRTVRDRWRLNGYIVSDCNSVDVLYGIQHYTPTAEEAAAKTIRAGLDLECGKFLAVHAEEAVRIGLLTVPEVNRALSNTLTVQMRLGMFDGDAARQAYGHLGRRDVCSPAHQQLALQAARQGIVLLKNVNSALPLSIRRHRTLAVIGPNADAALTMIGNYAGIPCGYTNPVQGIQRYAKVIRQQACIGVACPRNDLFRSAEVAARHADATVLVMGLDQSFERETLDRDSLLLPGLQQELVERVSRASRGPTVLVLMCGGPVDVSFAQNNPRIASILWVGYPGQAGGAAIADVLFGSVNPGGKLPMTWYPQSYAATVPMTEMAMRPDSKGYPGRTYRFYRGPTLYRFGFGLSYTRFRHSLAQAPAELSVPLSAAAGDLLPAAYSNTTVPVGHVEVSRINCSRLLMELHVDVANTGGVDGHETVLVYSKSKDGKRLVGYRKVMVAQGSQQRVVVNLKVCKALSVVGEDGIHRVPMGLHRLHVGDLRHSLSLQTTGGRAKP